jgi:hypothetical protein
MRSTGRKVAADLVSFPRGSVSAFEALADDLVARADRLRCSLDTRQRGVAAMRQAVELYERIIREERLRS